MGKARILGNIGTNAGNLATTATGIDVTGTVSADVVSSTTLTSDGITSDEYLISAISASIADTAVDIFVYNTAKDSDAGAWRKRTQHTSWYNETLNTGTRGSRKEFPAVAVIVGTADGITIYDGDDPDMPMWMDFLGGSNNIVPPKDGNAIHMLNGIMFHNEGHQTAGYGTQSINMIEDTGYHFNSTGKYKYNGNIADRNSVKAFTAIDTSSGIVNNIGNDVAMTVLPNAPIDAATGLPVPTIAVATAGGVSVIKDDGTVVNITESSSSTNNTGNVQFLDNNKLVFRADGDTSYKWSGRVDIPSNTRTYSYLDEGTMLYVMYGGGASSSRLMLTPPYSGDASTATTAYASYKNNVVAGTIKGFGQGTTDPTKNDTENTNLVNYTSSTYNTGWMNGDIKLATLSDTDDTNVTGAELVTNGTFDSNVTSWAAYQYSSANTTIAHDTGGDGGRMLVTATAWYAGATQTITGLTSGATYTASAEFVAGTNDEFYLQAVNTATAAAYASYSPSTHTKQSITFTLASGQTSVEIRLRGTNGSGTFFVDNVSVRLAVEDRSVNNKGLQVFGTITKTAVATGADLVAYSGFSASNYLSQPYNSALDFGTDDFSINLWFNTPDSSVFGCLFHRSATVNGAGTWNDSGPIIQFEFNQTNLRSGVWQNGFGGTNSIIDLDDGNYGANIWHMHTFVRSSGVLSVYHNGVFKASASGSTASSTVTNTSASTWIGNRPNVGNRPFNGDIALLRMSATAPSAAQIAKIYNDEKYLFQAGAQATLYGASDAVTALAYDDATELLHVGTSQGRSVFQGLRRVDNTTSAVGAAISASNGLVAED